MEVDAGLHCCCSKEVLREDMDLSHWPPDLETNVRNRSPVLILVLKMCCLLKMKKKAGELFLQVHHKQTATTTKKNLREKEF